MNMQIKKGLERGVSAPQIDNRHQKGFNCLFKILPEPATDKDQE
jgi:hypothetical protein